MSGVRVQAERRGWRRSGILVLLVFAALPQVALAQPFDAWLTLTGNPTNGFVEIPHHASLSPAGAFTFEAWVAISNSVSGEDCRSIAGKNFSQAWWLGQCNVGGQPTLRSYLRGSGSLKQGGIIPRGVWTHVAVVFTGTHRRHYINGELAAEFADPGALTPSPDEAMRIGSDEAWNFSPSGSIDEVRLWNVARTTSQIRASLNKRITVAQPGLIAVWPLNGNGQDIIGSRDGATGGSGTGFLTFPPSAGCGLSTVNALCLNGRFSIISKWRTNPTPGTPIDGNAFVVGSGASSGLFWFFSAENWEVMAKVLNGCGLNNRYWYFSASATNVFYRIEVTDVVQGEAKIYFNYPGPPAPAVTDTDAFATCP
jgi:hypothetical protein